MTLSNGAGPARGRLASAAPPMNPRTLFALTSMCWSPPLAAAAGDLPDRDLDLVTAPRSSQYLFVAWNGCCPLQASGRRLEVAEEVGLVVPVRPARAGPVTTGPPRRPDCPGELVDRGDRGGGLRGWSRPATALPVAVERDPPPGTGHSPLRLMVQRSRAPGSYSTHRSRRNSCPDCSRSSGLVVSCGPSLARGDERIALGPARPS